MSRPVRAIVLGVALVATLAVYALWLAPLEALLQARGHGIVGLELAWSPSRFGAIMTDWGSVGVDAARRQILWDFAFIPSYAVTLWSALGLAGSRAGGRAGGVAARVALAVPVAAALDCLENVSMLQALRGSAQSLFVPLASACASVKFLILLVAIVAIGWALVARGRRPG